MFRKGRYHGKVTWRQLLSLRAVRATNDGAIAFRCVYDCVWATSAEIGVRFRGGEVALGGATRPHMVRYSTFIAMMVDGGCSVRLRYHH
jgi:hypothetical protein